MFLQVKALGNSCSLYLMGSSTSKTSVMKGKNDHKYDTCWTTLTYVCVCLCATVPGSVSFFRMHVSIAKISI